MHCLALFVTFFNSFKKYCTVHVFPTGIASGTVLLLSPNLTSNLFPQARKKHILCLVLHFFLIISSSPCFIQTMPKRKTKPSDYLQNTVNNHLTIPVSQAPSPEVLADEQEPRMLGGWTNLPTGFD
jgi:hypothetical protein